MAGLFGFFNYEKPGKGVSKDEKKKEGVLLFLTVFFRKFWKIIKINLLYLLFCIPVVTIGPATAALTYILNKYSKEEHAFILSDFWDKFKENFVQGILAWIVDLLVYGVGLFNLYSFFVISFAGPLSNLQFFLVVLTAVYMLVYTVMRFYIYNMITSVKLSFGQILMNSFLLVFARYGANLKLVFFLFCLSFIHFKVPYLGYISVIYIIPAIGLLISCYVVPVIEEMVVKAEDAEVFYEE